MDCKIVKCTIIVAIPDYGMGGACARDHISEVESHEFNILDWQEEDMKIVPAKTAK